MKKIIYKSIFSIVIVLFAFLMLPNKQVKAQEEQPFPEVLMKVPYYYVIIEPDNVGTHEFLIRYKLNNILIDNLNDIDYFLVNKKISALDKGYINYKNSYELEEIEIEDNSTIFVVRLTLYKSDVNNYYGSLNNILIFFEEDSAFYIKYDVYNEGYNAGYGDGYERGLEEGYTEGYNNGYNLGLEQGYNVGYDFGYDFGYEDGRYDGYDEGYINGRDEGYNNGYNAGLEDGYTNGYDDGYNVGYSEGYDIGGSVGFEDGYIFGYDIGYNDGFNEGIKENWQFSRFLKSTFAGIGSFLAIELLPGVSIGAIIAVPIIFGIIAFILGRRRG